VKNDTGRIVVSVSAALVFTEILLYLGAPTPFALGFGALLGGIILALLHPIS